MKTLLKRNVKLYFRDKASLFFSMLSIIIIIALFALFLGQGNWGSNEIRDTWLMAGVLAVASITTSIGVFEVVISDRLNKVAKGFYASPVKRSHITAAYVLSPFIVGVLMTTATAIGFGIFILATGGYLPNAIGILQLFGMILLSNITGTAIIGFIVSLIKSTGAWNTIGTIIGTLSGFLMGVYMPIGNLPNPVQNIMILFPPFHSAMLFRQILMDTPLQSAYTASYGTLDTHELSRILGSTFSFGDFEITPLISILFLLASGAFFFWLSVMKMKKLER
ncbi:MAG: ABC transporter permease [Defluviitaleaceae bacterium]|nr:ABC transporter permease [Defluviitaleaceae bacterium]